MCIRDSPKTRTPRGRRPTPSRGSAGCLQWWHRPCRGQRRARPAAPPSTSGRTPPGRGPFCPARAGELGRLPS
eukprot:9534527-Alexandrium_andersonii.AAC.1